MSALMRLAATGSRAVSTTYVDDVFSAYTYTGNGSTQTINNGIDLAGKGGMVWIKNRTAARTHSIYDTARSATIRLSSETTNANVTDTGSLTAFDSNGFSLGAISNANQSAEQFASWTFRKAPKFFSQATATVTGGADATVSFSDLATLGMVIVKRTDSTGSWYVWHRSLTAGKLLYLEQTAAEATLGHITVSGTTVTLEGGVIANGTYIVYAWAHDTATDGIIQCGSFTVTGGARQTINLGWEPQYLLMKSVTNADTWEVLDTSRALTTDSTAAMLQPNSSAAESPAGTSMGARITATGFTAQNSNATYIYLAIRRPNKPPTLGTQIYQAVSRTGTAAVAAVTGLGFAPDLALAWRSTGGFSKPIQDRLRGANRQSYTHATDPEVGTPNELNSFNMDGVTLGTGASVGWWNTAGGSYINHFFKRAIGVFDVVCYTGSGSNKTEAHNLGVAPELWLMKGRSGTLSWRVGCTALSNTEYLTLESTAAKATDATAWNSTYPTSTVFSLGTQTIVNTNMGTFLAYLFATKAGISKVGSYTGTGTTKQVDCGFTTGARFVVIKRTDSTGAWYVWDTVRGIIAGNDPFSLLNSTAAEDASTDYIDPYTSGFELSSTAPAALNASGGTYLYLAIA